MTLKEAKKKALALIEEVNPDSAVLTDDPDIAAKINAVINQIMFELVRIRKLGKYLELPVVKGQLVSFADLEKACGYEVFQIQKISGVNAELRANGSVVKVMEDGTLEADVFVFPEAITEATKDSYEFELASDVLEILPYGVAADLLKSDVSAEYGSVYSNRYETMLTRLDPRYHTGSLYIEGGAF